MGRLYNDEFSGAVSSPFSKDTGNFSNPGFADTIDHMKAILG